MAVAGSTGNKEVVAGLIRVLHQHKESLKPEDIASKLGEGILLWLVGGWGWGGWGGVGGRGAEFQGFTSLEHVHSHSFQTHSPHHLN